MLAGGPSVDVELVALGVPQRDRVVVKALLKFLAQVAEQRGAEVAQPPGLGIHALLAGLDREVPLAAGVDVEVEAVADGLAVGHDLDPDARSGAIRIDDAVRAPAEPGLGQPGVGPPVVPGDEAGRWRLQHVAQGLGPEAGQRLGVADAVDDELVSDSHGSPLVRPRPRRTVPASMPGAYDSPARPERDRLRRGRAGPPALPPAVVLPTPLALLAIDQAMTQQRPVHTRPPGQRRDTLPLRLPADPR